ncbi:MAG: M23 family metallopeptidase [bacterium]|nr:MAG: M23 family metallopeptidase [bacterium]
MTSSFCEFRPRHYHAAIDIKTWNRTGYRTFAIEDGYIMRVRVSAFGYGKALYVKLNDGNIAVYAHLAKFTPELEDYVNSIRQKNQQYSLDLHLTPEKFPVKKGQLIAYTGKTGIGYPHLHFEIRNPKNQPINPLQFYREVVQDNYPPQLYEAAFFPQDHKSLINQQSDTVFIDLRRSSEIFLEDTLYISGKVGLALKCYDYAEGANNRFSFYRSNMWIDDSLVYSVQYDHFSYAHTEKIEVDKNYSLWRKGAGIFHNFYRHPANNLPHYSDTPPYGGIIDSKLLRPGLHSLRIELEDFSGNQSLFQTYFRTGEFPFLTYDLNRRLENELFLRIQSPLELSEIHVAKGGNPGEWSEIALSQDFMRLELDEIYHYTFAVAAPDSLNGHYLQISGVTSLGMPSFPLYLPLYTPEKRSEASTIFQIHSLKYKKDWIELKTSINYPIPSKLLNQLRKQIPDLIWFPREIGEYQINIPTQAVQDHQELLSRILPSDQDNFTLISTREKYRLYSRDQLFEAHFPVSALYDDGIVSIREMDSKEQLFAPPAAAGMVGKIYDLSPFDLAVEEGVYISLEAPDEHFQSAGMGLYYWDNKKGWLFIPTNVDSVRMRYESRVTSLEKFVLLQDTTPPVIYPVQSSRNGIIQSLDNQIRFTLKDEISGIRRESQITVLINGQWQLFEYDPEEDYIAIDISGQEKFPLQLMLSVTDNMGNQTIKEFKIQ